MRLLAITVWEAVSMILSGGTIATVITWLRFRSQDSASTIKTLAEAELSIAEKEIKLSDAAMKMAQRMSEEVGEAKAALDKSEKQLAEIKKGFYALEDDLRTERHKCNNLEQRVALLLHELQEISEAKAREIAALKEENERLKKGLPKK